MIKKLLVPVFFIMACNANTAKQMDALETETKLAPSIVASNNEEAPDPFLANIQEKIKKSFVQAFMTRKTDELLALDQQLADSYQAKNRNITLYWRAYLAYYTAIFYLQVKDKKKSQKWIEKGIDLMRQQKEKQNSEDYALLGLIQCFSIQFKVEHGPEISEKVTEDLKIAIELDSLNLRGYYALASKDFYMPLKYGGGKKVEKYLLKAIALPEQQTFSEYLPSWGKEEAYALLIESYLKKKKKDLAKKYYAEGVKAFPGSYLINRNASVLNSKK